ncbi:pseudouridine synthase [Brevundimonas lenta]|uniref:Pseudouridine synthase n=1 Tax=Brevundimonas lenta TaxID=424796 RepID=A0A7W6JDT0_9CAUL|nr:pseudouridine synthase [Brevundimonas lenta]MBB4083288.1 23S rRNA pseudouridine2605 synthase [Brevundimonas lenta]
MVSHPRDNDKKPRPRQDDSRDGPRKPYVKRVEGADDRGPPKGGKSFGKPGGKPFAKDGKPSSRDAKPGAKADEGPKRSERIAKAMARAGIASRREVERLIGLGKVAVNGKILDTPATLVTRDDVITVDGKPIGSAQATRVWRYHKPAGLVTSHGDPGGRPTVFDALPSSLPRVISVGRLDLNTEGLLILTNDGELSRALELPSTELVRQYRARARGRVSQLQLDSLKDGVTVDGVRYGPIEATLDKAKEKSDSEGRGPANLWISVSITEGKNREVRKVLEHLGLTVNRLIRLAYGPFQLGTLPVGSVEEVGPRVIREMLAQHIRPENLPTGNTVQTPAPIPGRRTSAPIVKGASGSAMSDPSRKPSRTRAAEAAASEGGDTGRRAPKGEGWAKAKPKFEHSKTFKPRERTAPRPADGERSDRDERPKRAFTPRADQFIDKPRGAGGPRKPGAKPAFGSRPAAEGDRPSRPFKPRDGQAPRGDAPFKRGGGTRSNPPGGARPGGSRPGGGGKGGPRGPR